MQADRGSKCQQRPAASFLAHVNSETDSPTDQAEQDLDLDPDLLFVTSFTQSMVACLDPSELGDPPTVTDTAQATLRTRISTARDRSSSDMAYTFHPRLVPKASEAQSDQSRRPPLFRVGRHMTDEAIAERLLQLHSVGRRSVELLAKGSENLCKVLRAVAQSSEEVRWVFSRAVAQSSEEVRWVFSRAVAQSSEEVRWVFSRAVAQSSEEVRWVFSRAVAQSSEEVRVTHGFYLEVEFTVSPNLRPGIHAPPDIGMRVTQGASRGRAVSRAQVPDPSASAGAAVAAGSTLAPPDVGPASEPGTGVDQVVEAERSMEDEQSGRSRQAAAAAAAQQQRPAAAAGPAGAEDLGWVASPALQAWQNALLAKYEMTTPSVEADGQDGSSSSSGHSEAETTALRTGADDTDGSSSSSGHSEAETTALRTGADDTDGSSSSSGHSEAAGNIPSSSLGISADAVTGSSSSTPDSGSSRSSRSSGRGDSASGRDDSASGGGRRLSQEEQWEAAHAAARRPMRVLRGGTAAAELAQAQRPEASPQRQAALPQEVVRLQAGGRREAGAGTEAAPAAVVLESVVLQDEGVLQVGLVQYQGVVVESVVPPEEGEQEDEQQQQQQQQQRHAPILSDWTEARQRQWLAEQRAGVEAAAHPGEQPQLRGQRHEADAATAHSAHTPSLAAPAPPAPHDDRPAPGEEDRHAPGEADRHAPGEADRHAPGEADRHAPGEAQLTGSDLGTAALLAAATSQLQLSVEILAGLRRAAADARAARASAEEGQRELTAEVAWLGAQLRESQDALSELASEQASMKGMLAALLRGQEGSAHG
ncbi:MAG: hypothetical protein WDW36_009506 [Sanguina aurantia]